LEAIFKKTTENETIKMTDSKTVRVDKCSPYIFSFKMPYSQESYKKFIVNNRRKTKSAAAQLVLQPVYANKLPVGDLTYLLTPWNRVLLEKLTGLQLVKKFPAFYRTRRFITALTSARHLSLS
jgi:hypothetical protein